MSLEAEAQAHMYKKKQQFLEALKEYAAYLEKFYDDNLHGSHEATLHQRLRLILCLTATARPQAITRGSVTAQAVPESLAATVSRATTSAKTRRRQGFP